MLPRSDLGEGIEMSRTEGFGSSTAIGTADDTRRRFKSSILGGRLVGLGNDHGLLVSLGRRWCNGDITRRLLGNGRGSTRSLRRKRKRGTKGILGEAMLLILGTSQLFAGTANGKAVLDLRGRRKAGQFLLRLLVIRGMRGLRTVRRQRWHVLMVAPLGWRRGQWRRCKMRRWVATVRSMRRSVTVLRSDRSMKRTGRRSRAKGAGRRVVTRMAIDTVRRGMAGMAMRRKMAITVGRRRSISIGRA